MKNKYPWLFLLMSMFSLAIVAQETNNVKEDIAYQKNLVFNNAISKENAIAQFESLYRLGKEYTFEGKKNTYDESGLTHQRHQQFYKGLKIEFGTLITHSRDGFVESINGELYDARNVNLTPTLTLQKALESAMKDIAAEKYLWEDKIQAEALNYEKPQGELIIFPNVDTGEVKLAYKYDIYSIKPISRAHVYVDAHSGEILFKNPIIKHTDRLISKVETSEFTKKNEDVALEINAALVTTGSAATRYSQTRSIETTFNGLNYVLNENTRGIGKGIVTYNSEGTETYTITDFFDNDNVWTEHANTNKDDAALDAHWGAEMTYDFWKNVFNRNSYDDDGAKIISHVHYGNGYENAFWNGSVMTYGDGNINGLSFNNPLTSVDVCGHEIGHAICEYTADLVYKNQSGALNEGFSDIWGTCVEVYGKTGSLNTTADTASPGTLEIWKMGEDCATNGFLRSMSYPRSKGQPDTYLGTNWATGTGDNGGVHTNSGVLNHWFYIVTAGKSGTNNATPAFAYNVTGIGMAKSAQIAYYAERDYLTPNSNYADARQATLAVTRALYCANSPEVIAVTKAWKAVNVGSDYVVQTNDVSLKSISGGNKSVACGTTYNPSIVIENGGSATINSVNVSYNIDGGTATNTTWNGILTTCSSVAFSIPVSGLGRGFHILNVSTTIAGDGNVENNSRSLPIIVNDNGVVNVVNNFNSANNSLVSTDDFGHGNGFGRLNTVWERGTVSKTLLTNAIAQSEVYATKLTGKYPNGITAYLVSQCYDLTNIANPTVNFDMAFDLEENYDFITFEYSTDSGDTWSILGSASDANWYNSSRTPQPNECESCPGKQWTGSYANAPLEGSNGMNGNKRNYSHTLSQFGFGGATPASNIIFRFKFFSDSGVNAEGAFVDNFVVQGTLSRGENSFEQFAVYPNPSKGKFNVVLSTSEEVKVEVFDIRGRSVYNQSHESQGAIFNKEIDLNTISSGVYILNIESAGKKEARRIIIE